MSTMPLTVHERVEAIMAIRSRLPFLLREAAYHLMCANNDLYIAKVMAATRRQRMEITGYSGEIEGLIVKRQHRSARRAAGSAAKALALLGLALPPKGARS